MSSDDAPTGALTFLFTDLVDSTYLWEQREADMEGSVDTASELDTGER